MVRYITDHNPIRLRDIRLVYLETAFTQENMAMKKVLTQKIKGYSTWEIKQLNNISESYLYLSVRT